MARIRYQSGSPTITFFDELPAVSVRLTGPVPYEAQKRAWLALTKLGAAKSVCALATAHLVASWATVMGYQK